MKYEFSKQHDNGVGSLRLTAESVPEVLRMQEVLQVFPVNTQAGAAAYAEALKTGVCTSTMDRPVLPETVTLKGAFKPYADLLAKLTGYQADNWELNLTPLLGGLQFAYVATEVQLTGLDVTAAGYGVVWEQEGTVKTNMADELLEEVGWRKYEPEFVAMANGLYKRNPGYALVRYPAQAGLGNAELWRLVFDHWRRQHASPGQREMLDRLDALAKGYEGHDYSLRPISASGHGGVYGHQLYVADPDGTIDWGDNGTKVRTLSWEEFKKL